MRRELATVKVENDTLRAEMEQQQQQQHPHQRQQHMTQGGLGPQMQGYDR